MPFVRLFDRSLHALILRRGVRLSLSLLLFLIGCDSAAAAGWNCQKSEVTKEWECSSNKTKSAKSSQQRGEATDQKETQSGEEAAEESSKPSETSETSGERHAARPNPSVEPAQASASALPGAAESSGQTGETAEAEQARAAKSEASQPAENESGYQPVFNPVPPVVGEKEDAQATPSKAPARTPAKDESPQAAAQVAATQALPAAAPIKKAGWSCRAGGGKEWDCALVGPDPRGEPHVVGPVNGGPTQNWSESPDMTREDEQRFSTIVSKMPADPFLLSCSISKYEWSPATDLFMVSEADRILREKSPLEIQSDTAELIHGESSNYQGSAEIARADQKLFGDFVTHNKESGALNAQGNVVYREKGLAFASDSALMKLNTDEGVLRNSQFILETVPARGTSRITHIDSKTKSRYETVTYTTCPTGNQDWLLHSTNATIDKETGEGTARNAWVEFKGVPFLYTPYMSFPVDDRRRSGFLSPMLGVSKINGFDITVPYYLNLAPNYDMTLMPRYMVKRGPLLRTDFRYLSEYSKGEMFADILPWDEIRHETRGQFAWRDQSNWTKNWSSTLDLHLISDHRYLFELGTLLGLNNALNLRSWGSINYNNGQLFGGNYSAAILADYYQIMNPTLTKAGYPYYRMPQLTFNYGREIGDTGLRFETASEFVNFDQPVLVTGDRLTLRPRLVYPFRDKAGYITPSLTMWHSEYWLNNTGPNQSSTFTRTAPIFSVDSGAYFDREFEMFDSPMQQTLEPRLFYLWVPKVAQPYNYNCTSLLSISCVGLNFDTNYYDFNYYQLFRENRFAGWDRLSDANQIVPALTTRFISQNNGLERLRVSLGKIFYIKQPEVQFIPNGPYTTNKDDAVGELSSMLSQHWNFRSTGQWAPDRNQLDRLQLALQYNNFANQLLNLSYRYRRDPYYGSIPPLPVNPTLPRTVNQTDISTRLPLWAGWFGIGRWEYDLESKVTVQALAGLEKETCCWRFSIVGLRYINGTTTTLATSSSAPANNALYFQLELKGLGRFGDQIDNLLMQNFSGYRTDYDIPPLQR